MTKVTTPVPATSVTVRGPAGGNSVRQHAIPQADYSAFESTAKDKMSRLKRNAKAASNCETTDNKPKPKRGGVIINNLENCEERAISKSDRGRTKKENTQLEDLTDRTVQIKHDTENDSSKSKPRRCADKRRAKDIKAMNQYIMNRRYRQKTRNKAQVRCRRSVAKYAQPIGTYI